MNTYRTGLDCEIPVKDARARTREPRHPVSVQLPLPVRDAVDREVARLRARGLSVSRGSVALDVLEAVFGRVERVSDMKGRARVGVGVTEATYQKVLAYTQVAARNTMEELIRDVFSGIRRDWESRPPAELPGLIESACVRLMGLGTRCRIPVKVNAKSPRRRIRVSLTPEDVRFLEQCLEACPPTPATEGAVPEDRGEMLLVLVSASIQFDAESRVSLTGGRTSESANTLDLQRDEPGNRESTA